MATKVKGLLKGLRYISQIFEEKDQEIQIGFPTDVKHVAHIGWDGPSANSTPSWMTEFKAPESTGQIAVKELSAKDHQAGVSIAQSLAHLNEIPRSASSPAKKTSDGKTKKQSRRNRSEATGMESPARDGSNLNPRRSRNSNNSLGSESPSHSPAAVPKARKKKGSTSTDGGSAKSSRRPRSKGHQNSLTDMSIEGSEQGSLQGSPRHPAFAGEKSSEIVPAGIPI